MRRPSGFGLIEVVIANGIAMSAMFVGLLASKSCTNEVTRIERMGDTNDLRSYLRPRLDCKKTVAADAAACTAGTYIEVKMADGSKLIGKYPGDPTAIGTEYELRASCKTETDGNLSLIVESRHVPVKRPEDDWRPLFNVSPMCKNASLPTDCFSTGYFEPYKAGSNPSICFYYTDRAATVFSKGTTGIYSAGTIAPGTYGDLIVSGGTINLSTGTYRFGRFVLASGTINVNVTAGPVRVLAKDDFSIGANTNVNVTGGKIGNFCVEAQNSIGMPSGFNLGANVNFRGLIFTPMPPAALVFGSNIHFTGLVFSRNAPTLGSGNTFSCPP